MSTGKLFWTVGRFVRCEVLIALAVLPQVWPRDTISYPISQCGNNDQGTYTVAAIVTLSYGSDMRLDTKSIEIIFDWVKVYRRFFYLLVEVPSDGVKWRHSLYLSFNLFVAIPFSFTVRLLFYRLVFNSKFQNFKLWYKGFSEIIFQL